MVKNIVIGLFVLALVVVTGLYLGNAANVGGTGQTEYFFKSFMGGIGIGGNACATATWNPASAGTSSVNAAIVSTDITLPGAVMGDSCLGSLTSATSSNASISCFITGTATATIRMLNIGTGALDLATGTAKVCTIK